MSDLKKSLRDYLVAQSAVTDLVSTRIRPRTLAQSDTMPAVVLDVVSSTSAQGLAAVVGWADARVQVTVFADTDREAMDAVETIRHAIQGFRGDWGAVTIRDVRVESGPYDLQELQPADGSDQWRYACAIDFKISHKQSTS